MLGTILKCIRLSQDKMLKEVSINIGHASSYICDIESGRKGITINMLKDFSKEYQVPVSKMLQWDEKAKEENLSFPEILMLCSNYEVKKLKLEQENVNSAN